MLKIYKQHHVVDNNLYINGKCLVALHKMQMKFLSFVTQFIKTSRILEKCLDSFNHSYQLTN